MRKLIFLLLISHSCFAQFYPKQLHPSHFDEYIKSPGIEWAMKYQDTVHFTAINLSGILRKRFDNSEIKVGPPGKGMLDYRSGGYYATKHEIYYGQHDNIPMFDSIGNVIKDNRNYNKPNPDVEFDSITYNLIELSQIFYIEKGKLKVYIPFVATKHSIITSQGAYLGPGEYFTTAFNYDHQYTFSVKDKVIFLQETNKRIKIDSISGYNRYHLKQLYERNMVETLWPYIVNGKIKIRSVETNKKLSIQEINESLNSTNKIVVPVFDSSGNYMSNPVPYREELNPSVFKEIEIAQKWYYNQTKNIVYCTIPQVILFTNRLKNGEFEKDASPVLKIIF